MKSSKTAVPPSLKKQYLKDDLGTLQQMIARLSLNKEEHENVKCLFYCIEQMILLKKCVLEDGEPISITSIYDPNLTPDKAEVMKKAIKEFC